MHDRTGEKVIDAMRTPLVVLVAVAGAVLAVLRRRQSQADVALWREATSDSSR